MNVVEVRSDLRMVLDSGPGQAYLLRRGSGVVVVDTGIAGQGDAIAAALLEWGLGRESVDHVLLTHWHPDHAGSAAELSAWPNAKVWAHHLDAPIIRGESDGSFPELPPAELALYSQIADSIPAAPPARVDRELADDERIDELGLQVISTPGHTDGSMALLFSDARVLFTGDIATHYEGQVILGPFSLDRAAAHGSFRRFAEIDVDIVCFGHGAPLVGDETFRLRAAASADEIPDPMAG